YADRRSMPVRCGFVGRLLLAGALLQGGFVDAQTRVLGTAVRMSPPPGFTPSSNFPGFQDSEHGASIMVTEIPGPAADIRGGMTRQGLATKGMTLLESSTVSVSGDEALLLYVSQKANDIELRKWILVGGAAERTFMVVGAFPAAEADMSDRIRTAVLSS